MRVGGDRGNRQCGHTTVEALAAAPEDTTFSVANITSDDLTRYFVGADAVVHLAWALQPSHDKAAQ